VETSQDFTGRGSRERYFESAHPLLLARRAELFLELEDSLVELDRIDNHQPPPRIC